MPTVAEMLGQMQGTTAPKAFETALTPAEEKAFQAWKAKYAPHDSGADYDLRGFFKEGLQFDKVTGHGSDKYKKPNHPTFSVESIYAKYRPDLAGRWDKDGTYVPPANAVLDKERLQRIKEAGDRVSPTYKPAAQPSSPVLNEYMGLK